MEKENNSLLDKFQNTKKLYSHLFSIYSGRSSEDKDILFQMAVMFDDFITKYGEEGVLLLNEKTFPSELVTGKFTKEVWVGFLQEEDINFFVSSLEQQFMVDLIKGYRLQLIELLRSSDLVYLKSLIKDNSINKLNSTIKEITLLVNMLSNAEQQGIDYLKKLKSVSRNILVPFSYKRKQPLSFDAYNLKRVDPETLDIIEIIDKDERGEENIPKKEEKLKEMYQVKLEGVNE